MGRDGYEDVCSMCHRSESSAGKMIHINENMCICRDCLQRSFDMMIHGARGFLVKPFTIDSVDNSITMATKGEPINSLVLQAKDRNEALVAMMMASTDNMASILRQSKEFETAKHEIPRYLANLNNSINLAHTFAKGGDDELLIALQKFCIERSKGPSTRLGRLRKKLQHER